MNTEPCCCGNPDCTDFEDRMAAWGIPLSEVTSVTFEIGLGQTMYAPMEHDFTMPEPPDGTRLEFEYHSDLYAAYRHDESSREAGWTAGDGGKVWGIYPGSVPVTWAEMCGMFGSVLESATRLVPVVDVFKAVDELDLNDLEMSQLRKRLGWAK